MSGAGQAERGAERAGVVPHRRGERDGRGGGPPGLGCDSLMWPIRRGAVAPRRPVPCRSAPLPVSSSFDRTTATTSVVRSPPVAVRYSASRPVHGRGTASGRGLRTVRYGMHSTRAIGSRVRVHDRLYCTVYSRSVTVLRTVYRVYPNPLRAALDTARRHCSDVSLKLNVCVVDGFRSRISVLNSQ